MGGLSEAVAGDVERQLRLFLQDVPHYAILLLDPTGIIRSANAGAERLFGHERGDLVGRPYDVLHTPAALKDRLPQQTLNIARVRGFYRETGFRVRRDGGRFDAETLVTPVQDEDGAVLGYGVIVQDVSARVAESDLLQQSESRLQLLVDTVLDTLVDGLIIIDRRGRIQLYNRACETLFGYSPADVLGRNVKMLMPPEISAEHDSYLANYQTTGIRKIIGSSREVFGQRRDGSQFPMHLAVGETSHGGDPIYIGVIRDLTQRNRTEEQLRQSQKMEAVGQLTGGIAHDFNNILMVIMANADELLDSGTLGRQDRAGMERILAATQRASDLTKQLLAFSRKQVLRPVPTDLNERVSGTVRLLRRTLGEHVEIDLVLADGLWPTEIDRAQLEAALVNICLNARDAMAARGGRLVVETRNMELGNDQLGEHPEAAPGRYAMLAVTDNGAGMAPEVVAHVFEPFFTTKEVGKGTGLGLSMVYGFVRQSHGYVHIYSEPGKGTTIRLYFPASVEAAGTERAAVEAAMPFGDERVLVVEDNHEVRAGIVSQLRSLGYGVDEAANGTAALEICEERRGGFDLLLTDVIMPGGMGGRELVESVRERWPQIAVVFMSGYTANAFARLEGDALDAQLLEKPFRKTDLARAVRGALDRARPF